MKRRLSFLLPLMAGLIVLSLCIYGYHLLGQRPGVPPSVPENALLRIGDVEIFSNQDRDAALVGKEIGDHAVFEVRDADGNVRDEEGKAGINVSADGIEDLFPAASGICQDIVKIPEFEQGRGRGGGLRGGRIRAILSSSKGRSSLGQDASCGGRA